MHYATNVECCYEITKDTYLSRGQYRSNFHQISKRKFVCHLCSALFSVQYWVSRSTQAPGCFLKRIGSLMMNKRFGAIFLMLWPHWAMVLDADSLNKGWPWDCLPQLLIADENQGKGKAGQPPIKVNVSCWLMVHGWKYQRGDRGASWRPDGAPGL